VTFLLLNYVFCTIYIYVDFYEFLIFCDIVSLLLTRQKKKNIEWGKKERVGYELFSYIVPLIPLF